MFRDYLVNYLYLQKINLKTSLSRGSHFKIYLRLEYRGNRGSRQNFHGILFSKDRILINSDNFISYHTMITCLSKEQQSKSKHGCQRHGYRRLTNSYQNAK